MVDPRRERKVVTVVFADLVGFTAQAEQLDPEDVEAILRPYHVRLRSELERFGGTVEKFIGDAVMALFGAPMAHEDDPERAVRAALAIRDWAREEESAQVRIAVNTGEALINLGARPEAGEGMAAGDVVNTTARLQSAAPVNGVLVGETTYRATRQVIDYREAVAVEAKGKTQPLPVWEAVAARARVMTEAVSTSTPLVGRERELAVLRELLVRVREESSPQLVTLVGVPGIGKSRLVHELMQAVEHGGVLTYWRRGRSLPYGEAVPLWALSEIVKAQAGILESDPSEDVERKLQEEVARITSDARDAIWIESQVRALVGIAAPDDEPAGDRGTEAFAAWRRFFEGMAEQRPLVLVFEDLHWADDELLEFVDYLVDWATGVPILIVCTARPELLERRPSWGGGKLNATTLSLAPLTEADTSRLLASLLERPLLAAETQRALLARSGGNPLYAEQYAAMLLEEPGGTDLPMPESVQGIIAARLDRLPQEEKHSSRTPPSWERCSGSAVWSTDGHAAPPKLAFMPSSARGSCNAHVRLRSGTTPSTRSFISSFATSPTGRSRERNAPGSTAASPSGSSRLDVPRTTRRRSPTTTRQPLSLRGRADGRRTSWQSAHGSPCGRQVTEQQR
jgi:class 3 adenylate cyclase